MTGLDSPIETSWLERPPRVVSNSTLREVAATMEDCNMSCVLVGMATTSLLITDHDLAGALAAGFSPDVPVDQVAVKSPAWATESTKLLEAIDMMITHDIRHLLVFAPDG